VSAKNLSATADVPRVRVAGARLRLLQFAAVVVIPIAAVALALTFRTPRVEPPLVVYAQTGSYQAKVDTPLSVTAFHISNRSGDPVTIRQVRVVHRVAGLKLIGALAFRGCNSCVADSSVPPKVTPPTDVAAPKLVGLSSVVLKPGATLTVLLSVSVSRTGRVRVPPLRMDLASGSNVSTIETLPGPELCAGKGC
jgi:hypothetical protein